MNPENKQAIIEIDHLTKQYYVGKNKVAALNDVSLQIMPGEFVAVTGESGSGKSTLLQLIGCLDKPTSGHIFINGQDTAKLSDSQMSTLRQSMIGFVFQSFYLQPFLKLDENIAVPAMFKGLGPREIDEKVIALLEQVGLGERRSHFPKELSGGQIQRAAIARALVNDPKLLLADEPTGNLDSKNSDAIIKLFQDIRVRSGTTIVIVTHNAEIASQADRIITLRDGAIV
ncbi:MAG TPA: ABC transporter ATP-binding protein [Candidatus Saccharimonadales bacterium]|nr:ABC transporter ATP-binding protein [Candidatus Saccharimonadales bacterium]